MNIKVNVFKDSNIIFIYNGNIVKRYDLDFDNLNNGEVILEQNDLYNITFDYNKDRKCPVSKFKLDVQGNISDLPFDYLDSNNLYLYNGDKLYRSEGVFKNFLTDEVVLFLDENNMYTYTNMVKFNSTKEDNYNDMENPVDDLFSNIGEHIEDFVKNSKAAKEIKEKFLKTILDKGSHSIFKDIFKNK